MAVEPRLVVVRRGYFATYELLTRTFADDQSVHVIWDRRIGERRRSQELPGQDRRHRDRRRAPPMQWKQLNYLVAENSPIVGLVT